MKYGFAIFIIAYLFVAGFVFFSPDPAMEKAIRETLHPNLER